MKLRTLLSTAFGAVEPARLKRAAAQARLAWQGALLVDAGERPADADPTPARAAGAAEQHTRLETVFVALTDAVFLLDHERVCILANPAARALTRSVLVGARFDELRTALQLTIPDGLPPPVDDPLDFKRPTSSQPIRDVVRRMVDASGVARTLSINAFPLRRGELASGTVVSMRDVTREYELRDRLAALNEELVEQNEELRVQEEELRMQAEVLVQRQTALGLRNEQLARASRHKSEFLATMSHELRTPLNAIIGFSEMLLDDEVDHLAQSHRERVADVLQAGRHLLSLISDILDLSKVEAGRMEVSMEVFDVAEAIGLALGVVSSTAREKRLTLETDVPAGLRPIRSDPARLRQVTLNLLSNAVKFTPERGRVVVRAEDRGDRVRVAVTDNGIGIDPAQTPRLFQPFSQLDSGSRRHFGGTGLGLSISRRLIELLGGEIGFEGAPGGGATFWYEVPFASPGESRAPRRRSVPVPTRPPSAEVQVLELEDAHSDIELPIAGSAPAPHVLIVDDNDVNRRVMRAMLGHLGRFTIDEAPDGATAVQLAAAHTPHVALVDIQMPGMDGVATLQAIHGQPATRDLPMIAVTAHAMAGDEARFLEAGFSAYVSKPIARSVLQNALRSALGATWARRD